MPAAFWGCVSASSRGHRGHHSCVAMAIVELRRKAHAYGLILPFGPLVLLNGSLKMRAGNREEPPLSPSNPLPVPTSVLA